MSKNKPYLQVITSEGVAVSEPPQAAAEAPKVPGLPEVRSIADPPPEFLADEGKLHDRAQIWHELISQNPGCLTDGDRFTLAALVNSIRLHRIAAEKVAEIGSVIKSPSNYPIQNPYVADMNKQAQMILRYSAELGLTPASRSRAKGHKQKPNSARRNPFADLKTLSDD